MKSTVPVPIHARAATIDVLLKEVVPLYLNPPPSRRAFKEKLDREKVQRFKSNPVAARGGGEVYYSVADVEKLLRRMFSSRIAA